MKRIDQPTHQPTPAAVRAAQAAQITGFRIMRQFEIAPGWWGQPSEVGETGSATVADSFCREQNAVTLDPNRSKRIEYYADPIYADETDREQTAATANNQPTPKTVAHTNGLTFKVIDGNSNFARVARNVRQLTMADGSTWTVGLPIGWRGTEAAWHTTETPAQAAARIHAYGESIARRDRIQLGLRTARTTAVTA